MGSKAEHDKLPLYRWVILVIASLLIFMTSYVQFQISSLSSLIIPQFNLDAVEFSSLLLAPLLSGVFLSIPSGVLCDRFGPRTVVGVATAFSVAAAFVRIFAGDYLTLFGTMVVLGVCPAVLQASLIKVFCVWFKGDSDFAMGIYFASASVGIACSQATSNLFGSLEAAFLTSSLVFLGCGIAWVVLARDVPAGEAPPPRESLSQYLRVATSSKSVWLIAAAVGLGMATSTAYMGLFPQALIDTHAFNPEAAGITTAVLSLGSIAGSLVGPLVCQRIGNVKTVLITIVVAGGVTKLLSWLDFGGVEIWALLLLNGAFGAAAGPILEALPAAFPEIGHRYAGSAGGVVGSASLAISFALPLAISGVSGFNYSLNLGLEALFFTLAVIPIVLLPHLPGSHKKRKPQAQARQR